MANMKYLTESSENAAVLAKSFSTCASAISKSTTDIAQAIAEIGNTIALLGKAAADGVDKAAAALQSFAVSAAKGLTTVAQALPVVSTAITNFAATLASMLTYLPEIAIFMATMALFSFIGEGLLAAGQGILSVAEGMMLMATSIPLLAEGLTSLIEQFGAIGEYIVALIGIVVVSAAMFILAEAMQKINEQLLPLNKSFEQLKNLAGAGFIAGIGVLLVFVLGLTACLNKTASGLDKVTAAMKKQATQLAVLNPLLAAQAVLKEPISGVITVALAVASAAMVSAVMPAMATGGIVNSPTVALVGEGRYPEAVVPLGDSPQFNSMKSDIAAAVAEIINEKSTESAGNYGDIVINIDGREFARSQFNNFRQEARRRGVSW